MRKIILALSAIASLTMAHGAVAQTDEFDVDVEDVAPHKKKLKTVGIRMLVGTGGERTIKFTYDVNRVAAIRSGYWGDRANGWGWHPPERGDAPKHDQTQVSEEPPVEEHKWKVNLGEELHWTTALRFPHSATGGLVGINKAGDKRCTVTLISDHYALTAAECLLDNKTRKPIGIKGVKAYFRNYDDMCSGGEGITPQLDCYYYGYYGCNVDQYFIPKSYQTSPATRWNFAVIKISGAACFPRNYGWVGMFYDVRRKFSGREGTATIHVDGEKHWFYRVMLARDTPTSFQGRLKFKSGVRGAALVESRGNCATKWSGAPAKVMQACMAGIAVGVSRNIRNPNLSTDFMKFDPLTFHLISHILDKKPS